MSVWVSHQGPGLTAEDHHQSGLVSIDVAGTNANGDKPVRLALSRCDPEDVTQAAASEEGRSVEMTAAETRELIGRLTETLQRWT